MIFNQFECIQLIPIIKLGMHLGIKNYCCIFDNICQNIFCQNEGFW